jgi:PAS domain-containing protein
MRTLVLILRPSLNFFSESKSSLRNFNSFLDHKQGRLRFYYRQVFDATAYIIIQTDPNGKIIFANKAVSFLGFDVFHLIG